jgi:hypothetical protein
MSIDSLVLNGEQQLELSRIAQSRSLPAGYVFRARLILMLAEGASFSAIKQRLGTAPFCSLGLKNHSRQTELITAH